MEEQMECGTIANHNFCLKFIKIQPSPEELKKEEFEKQYQLMNLARLRMSKEIDQQKADERQINKKLMRFPYLDKRIEWKMQEIKNIDRWALGKVKPSLPIKSIPRTTGFLHLPGKDARTPPITPDQKRCQKRLIIKGKIDIEYLRLVQEELLSLKKSDGMTLCGTQELRDLIKSMEQRIEHGNKKRDDETKIYHDIRKLKETRELYTAPEPESRNRNWYFRERRPKRDTDWERSLQHQIHIRLDDIEKIKKDLSGRKASVRRLKAKLEQVRKRIKCLNRELENVNSKRLEAYKRAYELGEQKKDSVL